MVPSTWNDTPCILTAGVLLRQKPRLIEPLLPLTVDVWRNLVQQGVVTLQAK